MGCCQTQEKIVHQRRPPSHYSAPLVVTEWDPEDVRIRVSQISTGLDVPLNSFRFDVSSLIDCESCRHPCHCARLRVHPNHARSAIDELNQKLSKVMVSRCKMETTDPFAYKRYSEDYKKNHVPERVLDESVPHSRCDNCGHGCHRAYRSKNVVAGQCHHVLSRTKTSGGMNSQGYYSSLETTESVTECGCSTCTCPTYESSWIPSAPSWTKGACPCGGCMHGGVIEPSEAPPLPSKFWVYSLQHLKWFGNREVVLVPPQLVFPLAGSVLYPVADPPDPAIAAMVAKDPYYFNSSVPY